MRIDYAVVFPEACHGLRALDDTVHRSDLEPALVALVSLRVSQVNGATSRVARYARDARALGVGDERLSCIAMWRDSAVFTARERAALAWCEAVTTLPPEPSLELVAAEVGHHFTPRETVALTLAIAAANCWDRFSIGLGETPPLRRAAVEGTAAVGGNGSSGGVAAGTPRAVLEDRLRRLEDEIAAVRRTLAPPPGHHYYESGTIHPELDDQTITPPG